MRRSCAGDDYFFFIVILVFYLGFLFIMHGWLHLYLGLGKVAASAAAPPYRDNDLYLLSAVAQSLAAILALVITISLVIIQLSAHFVGDPAVVRVHLSNYKLWVTIPVSLVAIFWNLVALGRIKNSPPAYDINIDFGLLLAFLSMVLFIPYLLSALERVNPEASIDVLVGRIRIR